VLRKARTEQAPQIDQEICFVLFLLPSAPPPLACSWMNPDISGAFLLLLMPASARFLVLDKAVFSLLRYALFRVEHVSFVPAQVKIGTFLFQRLKP